MTKDIRLVICDLDGTLLNSEKKITERLKNNVDELHQNGILFSICTGRIPGMMRLYSKKLNIKIPTIASNGAYITDINFQNTIYKKVMDFCQVKGVMEYLRNNNIQFAVLTDCQAYFTGEGDFQTNFILYNRDAASFNMSMEILYVPKVLDGLKDKDITKLLVFTQHDEEAEKVEEYIKVNTNFYCTSSRKNLLDIGPNGVNKGKGVELLANELGIRLEEVCVFGDYYNDISMFNKAGLSIAMGNAVEELKGVADYITDDNDSEGVSKAIEKILLKR
ncbi:Cof-type HAD-IIB family hydrolase [Tepidimicrobium xylanilyticum]|uniref:Cof-type HAD-IIB family hydrolase n=1 Tax=Tepidimicrobium xylanilyticum TaxID=1123352 RepID=UPI002653ADAC|nr:Cof-type HAD-IIB family hydrolase [Tepidimicrobium xylanilyticum]GMG95370.1 haloacid dehalogenase [Tepidimicrobium xylanilyticum]